VQMLFTMIFTSYGQSGHFDEIENEIVTRLDTLFMSENKGDDLHGAFFVAQLRHLFDSSEVDEQLRERVGMFLDSVDLFLELLLSVRALPEGEEFADERVIATVIIFSLKFCTSDLIYV
jgi:dedicator of cytokinesis protein 3